MDRRIALLRRLAASTTFKGEREAALAKAAELEARGGSGISSHKSRSVAPPSPFPSVTIVWTTTVNWAANYVEEPFTGVVSDTVWTPTGRRPTSTEDL